MSDDFTSKQSWDGEGRDDSDSETMEDWLKKSLHPEVVDQLEAMRVKYEVISFEDLVLTALLTLLLIEERESIGERMGWFSYEERDLDEKPRVLKESLRLQATIITLDRLMRDACGE